MSSYDGAPQVSQVPPPAGLRRHRRSSQSPPTALLVVAILAFVQAGLTALGGVLSTIALAVVRNDLNEDFPYVDSEGNRYESPDAYGDGEDVSAGELTYSPTDDLEVWELLVFVLGTTLVISLVVLFLAFKVLGGRRWACAVLAVVQLLLLAGSLVRLVVSDGFVDPSLVLTLIMPIAILGALAVAVPKLRRSGNSGGGAVPAR